MKIAIITAIYGHCDDLKEYVKQDVPCDFYCFSDTVQQPEKSMWRVIRELYHLNSEYVETPAFQKPNIRAKYYRLQSHKISFLVNYDYVIWIDASMHVFSASFARDMVGFAGDFMALYQHPKRECAFSEAKFCVNIPKYKTEALTDQIAAYRAAGMPENFGLWATGILPRKICAATNAICNDWFRECVSWTIQDQVSLPFILWRHNCKPNTIPGNVYWNDYHKKLNHSPGYEELGKK